MLTNRNRFRTPVQAGSKTEDQLYNVKRFISSEECGMKLDRKLLHRKNLRPITTLYVKNFDKNMTSEMLIELFKKFGSIKTIRLIRKDGISTGCCFIAFDSIKAATKAVDELNGKKLLENGKYLTVRFIKENTVLVKNLNESIRWRTLYNMFTKCGKVRFAEVIFDERGFNRGYSSGRGIVRFETNEEAYMAVAQMHGKYVLGKRLHVELQKSEAEQKRLIYNAYFTENQHKTTTSSEGYQSENITSFKAANHWSTPIKNDVKIMAAEKQNYADIFLPLVKSFGHLRDADLITLILLELDNTSLSIMMNCTILLKTKVDEIASLITIGRI